MKLDWKRAGCASIAECGAVTFNAYRSHDAWFATHTDSDDYGIVGVGNSHQTREAAESACESWLEQHDRPEWHDVTDWLSWAEWRGAQISIGTMIHDRRVFRAVADIDPRTNWQDEFTSVDEAKAAAEKWVREHGAQ